MSSASESAASLSSGRPEMLRPRLRGLPLEIPLVWGLQRWWILGRWDAGRVSAEVAVRGWMRMVEGWRFAGLGDLGR